MACGCALIYLYSVNNENQLFNVHGKLEKNNATWVLAAYLLK